MVVCYNTLKLTYLIARVESCPSTTWRASRCSPCRLQPSENVVYLDQDCSVRYMTLHSENRQAVAVAAVCDASDKSTGR